jgi:hypothetical protein
MMSIDLIAQEAGRRLRAAAADADPNQALEVALGPLTHRRNRRQAWSWGVAVAAAVLLAVWLVGPAASVLRSAPVDPIRPVGVEAVGAGLPVPLHLAVPDGWRVEHDGGFVKLVPEVGQAATAMYLGVPTRVYDNTTGLHSAADLGRGGLTQWTLDNPFLRPVDRRGIEVDGVDGEQMGLRLPTTYHDYSDTYLLSLVLLKDKSRQETVHFGRVFKTFEWAVLTLGDKDILVAGTSAFPNDPLVKRAFGDTLRTLRFECPTYH